MKIMMVVMAIVMMKCSGLEKKRKIKWAQGKGDNHMAILF